MNRTAHNIPALLLAVLVQGPVFAQPPNRTPFTPSNPAGSPPRSLPQDAGQVWREYDLTPFTQGLGDDPRPHQHAVDWVLRETGTDVWLTGPLGILNADRQRLRVYHTPEIQQKVAEIVNRLVATDAQAHVLAIRLLSVGHPDWRLKALPWLEPVQVQSAGVDGWLVAKEDLARLLADLRRRTDFREYSASQVVIPNGQSTTLQQRTPRGYAKSVRLTGSAWPGYELIRDEVMEGYVVTVSPLFTADGALVEAAIQCQVDQVEQLRPMWVDVPTAVDPRQRVEIQIPQISGWQLQERFRWPIDKVLVVSRGVASPPTPSSKNTFLPVPQVLAGPSRADALLVLEPKTAVRRDAGSSQSAATRTTRLDSRGRY